MAKTLWSASKLVIVHRLITFLVPFFLTSLLVTVLVSPALVRLAYGRSGFPPDTFGLAPLERQQLAEQTIASLQWFSDEQAESEWHQLKVPGQIAPFFSTPELNHLADVKRLTDLARWAAVTSFLGLAICLVLLVRQPPHRRLALRAVRDGSLATIIASVVLAVVFAVAWEPFFSAFHQLFFPSGTYTFSTASGLIRLFPDAFFSHVALIFGLLLLLISLMLLFINILILRRTSGSAEP